MAVVAGAQTLTFRALDEQANRLARRLRALGMGPDRLAAVCLQRSLALPVALLGVLKAGGAYVPLDPTYPRDRLGFMLEDSAAPVLITERALIDRLPAGNAEVLALDTLDLSAESAERLDGGAAPDNLCYVIYTSGSTGRPKGAMLEHSGVANYLRWAIDAYRVGEGRGAPVHSSIAFDLTVTSLFAPLLSGKPVVLLPEDKSVLALGEALRDGDDFSLVKLTPSHLEAISSQLDPATVAGKARALIIGGEALLSHHVAFFREHAPKTRLINEYGPTETVVGCAVFEIPEGALASGAVPIGRPIANTRLYVLDRGHNPLPVGVAGEIYIGGAQVGRGYLNRPELTAERFLADPFVPGGRMYRSGDLGRHTASGDLQYLGRIDQQVKIRGNRVELGEIEAVLGQHPGVREVVVVLREDTPGDQRLAAYWVEGAATITAASLRSLAQEKLPEAMVPSAFVRLDALPLTPNGKVDRKSLPVPEKSAIEGRAPALPQGPIEEGLVSIFAEVLKQPAESVGAHDSFFELGGHSLLAMQAISRIRAAFEVELPLRAVFEAPTPSALGRRIEEALRSRHGLSLPPLVREPAGGDRPLSFAQERLWFLDQLSPGDASYNTHLAMQLGGALDIEALGRALTELVRRHEALRTTFFAEGGKPVQIIHDAAAVPLPVTTLTSLPDAERQAAALQGAEAEIRTPFDLAEGPLLRAHLFTLAEDAHLLVLVIHHIVSDGWSVGVLQREVAALYDAFRRGEPSPLPDLPVQYADFAAWQRRWLSGEVLDRQLGYWTSALRAQPEPLDLPADRPRPAVPSHRGARQIFALPADLSSALRALARKEGATLFMVLLSAFDVLLHRITGQGDLAVGSPIANRTAGATEGLIGFFVNTLVLRARIDDATTFSTLLAQVRETCLSAYAHQDIPFERLVQELAPERDLSRQPLFQVVFGLQTFPESPRAAKSGKGRGVNLESGTAKFDLTLLMNEGAGAITGRLEYAVDLFDAATIARMIGHFQNLLSSIVKSPDKKLWELAMLGEEERQQLLAPVAQGAPVAPPPDLLIHEIVESAVDRFPDRIALTFAGESLTYRELDERSNQLAHRLRALGVGPDVLVGLCVQRSLAMVIGILGILKAGGAYLPLDPEYPKDRLAFMVEDAGAPVLVTQAEFAGLFPASKAVVLRLDADWPSIAGESAARLPRLGDPSHLAYVIYTSGSTGRPKGVLIPHSNVVRLFRSTERWFGFDERDVVTLFHSYAFDFTVWELWAALFHGGRLVVVPYWVSRAPEAFYKLLCDEGVTVLSQTPSAFRQLIHAEQKADADTIAKLALRTVVFGGEALDLGDLRPFWDRHGDEKPSLVNMYGITETTVHVTYRPVSRADLSRPWSSVIGCPIPDLTVYVLDPHKNLCPIGVPGEMYVGGAGVARGYLNRPELTAERFLPDPFSSDPKARLYKTGDLARRLASGDLEYLGRIDHQVKIRGHRIETGEIEAALDLHPGVREAVVVPRDYGPSDRRLVAYVVAESEPGPSTAELRAFLREKLPDYMVPAAFVTLLALPLTENGKVDRKALPAPEAAAG
ncbi:MAG: amino acid adenylation domain-containing protein, partial [Byssovorax sp.]